MTEGKTYWCYGIRSESLMRSAVIDNGVWAANEWTQWDLNKINCYSWHHKCYSWYTNCISCHDDVIRWKHFAPIMTSLLWTKNVGILMTLFSHKLSQHLALHTKLFLSHQNKAEENFAHFSRDILRKMYTNLHKLSKPPFGGNVLLNLWQVLSDIGQISKQPNDDDRAQDSMVPQD